MQEETIKKIAVGLILGVIVAFTFQKETCYRDDMIISCDHESFDGGKKYYRASGGRDSSSIHYTKLTKPNVPYGAGAAIAFSSLLILLGKKDKVD